MKAEIICPKMPFDKEYAMRSPLDDRARTLISTQRQQLSEVTSVSCFNIWRDSLVESIRPGDASGPALGLMLARLTDRNGCAREEAASYFACWRRLVAMALRQLQDRGKLRWEADPDELATGLIAGVQGGYLRARASRDADHLAKAIEMALERIRSFADHA